MGGEGETFGAMSRTIRKVREVTASQGSEPQRHYERVARRLEAVPMSQRVQPNIDLQDAGVAVLGLVEKLQQPGWKRAIDALVEAGLVDATLLADAATLAWAAIYVRRNLLLASGTATSAKVAPELASEAIALRARMYKLVEYHLGDDAGVAAQLGYIAEGSGHLDTANDLEALSDLVASHVEALAKDVRFYRASDVVDARRLAREIYTQLGVGRGAGEVDWGALQGAVWPLLQTAYAEVRRVGRFLARGDEGDAMFPSLVTAARARPSASKADEGAEEPKPEPKPGG